MKLNFGENIRKYRRERDLTQDDLAQAVGVTYQSVSKWERNEGYPDIALLPVIARYFGITVDTLLGNDRTGEIIDGYERESAEYYHTGDMEKNLALWEKAYEEFPEDLRVMQGLMYAINNEGKSPVPMDDAERIVSLGEKILERSTDQHQRENIISYMSYVYSSIGDKEKALYYADMGGSLSSTREKLRLNALEGEDVIRESQIYLASLIYNAASTAMSLGCKYDLPLKESVEALQFAVDITERLYSDGNVGSEAFILSFYYYMIAVQYAIVKDTENTLKALGKLRDYAVYSVALPEKMDYTAPLVNRMKYDRSEWTQNYKGNTCNVRLSELMYDRFDFIREDDGFKTIVADLEKHAEKI